MKNVMTKKIFNYLVIVSFMLGQAVAFAASKTNNDSESLKHWNQYKDSQEKISNLDEQIALAESTKMAYSILKKQFASKKKELEDLQDQIAFTESDQKQKLKTELSKLDILKKQITEIDGRLSSVTMLESLGVNSFDELDPKIEKLNKEKEKESVELNILKRKLVLTDSRFDKIQKIYKRKLEIERQLGAINNLESLLSREEDHHMYKTFGIPLTLLAFIIYEAPQKYDLSTRKFAKIDKLFYGSFYASLGYLGWAVFYGDGKTMDNLKAAIDTKKKAFEIDYNELSDQFDIYSTVIGVN